MGQFRRPDKPEIYLNKKEKIVWIINILLAAIVLTISSNIYRFLCTIEADQDFTNSHIWLIRMAKYFCHDFICGGIGAFFFMLTLTILSNFKLNFEPTFPSVIKLIVFPPIIFILFENLTNMVGATVDLNSTIIGSLVISIWYTVSKYRDEHYYYEK